MPNLRPRFRFFSLLECKKQKVDLKVSEKTATLSAKCVLKNTNNHSGHGLLSFSSSLPSTVELPNDIIQLF